MIPNGHSDEQDARSNEHPFDTVTIAATMNRLMADVADATRAAEVIELRVLGPVTAQQAHMHISSKLLYRANNCVVSIHTTADSGALKGLESGIAAD